LLTMVVFSLFGFPQPDQKSDLALPPQLGGYSLSKQITGSSAVSEFTELHGKNLAVQGGVKGIYGEWGAATVWVAEAETETHGKNLAVQGGVKGIYGEWGAATVWVAEAETETAARQLLTDMEAKIAEGRSPFTPHASMVVNDRTIYVLDGMGQSHFYFLSGKALIWLAANTSIAVQALQDALNFYQ